MMNKLLVATMVVATACAASAKTLYVDCNRANDDGPGTTEATAYQHNARYTAIGAANHNPQFFRGAIADLSFRVR